MKKTKKSHLKISHEEGWSLSPEKMEKLKGIDELFRLGGILWKKFKIVGRYEIPKTFYFSRRLEKFS